LVTGTTAARRGHDVPENFGIGCVLLCALAWGLALLAPTDTYRSHLTIAAAIMTGFMILMYGAFFAYEFESILLCYRVLTLVLVLCAIIGLFAIGQHAREDIDRQEKLRYATQLEMCMTSQTHKLQNIAQDCDVKITEYCQTNFADGMVFYTAIQRERVCEDNLIAIGNAYQDALVVTDAAFQQCKDHRICRDPEARYVVELKTFDNGTNRVEIARAGLLWLGKAKRNMALIDTPSNESTYHGQLMTQIVLGTPNEQVQAWALLAWLYEKTDRLHAAMDKLHDQFIEEARAECRKHNKTQPQDQAICKDAGRTLAQHRELVANAANSNFMNINPGGEMHDCASKKIDSSVNWPAIAAFIAGLIVVAKTTGILSLVRFLI